MDGGECGAYIRSEVAVWRAGSACILHAGSAVTPKERGHIAMGWIVRGGVGVLCVGHAWRPRLRVVVAWLL